MKKGMWTRIGASVLALACCLALMTGCGDKEENPSDSQLSEEVIQAQKEAENEYEAHIEAIKKLDVFENTGELKAEPNLVETYYEISTEQYEDMVAYRPNVLEPEQLPTYIFIGKMTGDAVQSDLSLELLSVAKTLEGTDRDGTEIQVAASNGYIIMAAAPNGADIADKFVQVTKLDGIESCDDIFDMLSVDLTTIKAEK